MAKERLYDSLTEEDHDIFGYYAVVAYDMLSIRFGKWRRHFEKSKQSLEDTRIIAWTQYRETMEGARIPAEKISGFQSPGNPASKIRGMMISQIFDEILSPHLQGDEYFQACRKISSIMSVRTWIERRRKEAARLALLAQQTSAPVPRPKRPAPTMAERRERWNQALATRPACQEDMGLRGTTVAVHETAIAALPRQTAALPQFEATHEVTLLMPIIDAEAAHEQKLNQDKYPQPKWLRRTKRRKYYVWD